MFSKKLIKYAAATTVAINCAYQPFGDVNNQFCTKHTVCDSDTKLDTKQRKQIKDEIRKLSLKKSIPDQPKRFKKAKDTQNERYLNIDAVYDANYVRGKYVLITGGNRGIGLELVSEYIYTYIL